MSDAPLVSIVTPSLNQGRFLEDAISSVLDQEYSRIEYWVVDGGSDDETVDLLRSYGDRLRWISEPDSGQAEAINKGFRRCRGEILAWLNADDVYAPGAIASAVAAFAKEPGAGLVFGEGQVLDEVGDLVGSFPGTEPVCLWRLVHFLDYILQPATFFRRSVFEAVGGVREHLHYGLDWDLWIRMAGVGEHVFLQQNLAANREYPTTKTSSGAWRRVYELGGITREHCGRFWTPGVRLYALDTACRALKRRLPRPAHDLVDALCRRGMGRTHDRLQVHEDGWMGPRAAMLVPRRWRAAEVTFEVPSPSVRRSFRVELSHGGRMLQELRVGEPGEFRLRFDLPAGPEEDLVEVGVHSSASFVPPDEKRRVSLRCVLLRPAPAGD